MERPTFRPAARADLPALANLLSSLEAADAPPTRLEDIERAWDRIQAQEGHQVHVAELDGAVIGTFSLAILPALAHGGSNAAIVENVVVDSSCRGRGIGRTMMAHALDLARAAGCYKLALSSNNRRQEAHRFYETLGFARHGVSFALELEPSHA